MAKRDFLAELKDRKAAAGEDRRTDHRVRLHLRPLVVGQTPGLEQDGVWHAELSDVVQRARVADALHEVRREADSLGQQHGQRADAVGVLVSVVVAVLGGEGEAPQVLEAGGLHVARALDQQALELVVLLPAGSDVAGACVDQPVLGDAGRRPREPAVRSGGGAVAVLEVDAVTALLARRAVSRTVRSRSPGWTKSRKGRAISSSSV